MSETRTVPLERRRRTGLMRYLRTPKGLVLTLLCLLLCIGAIDSGTLHGIFNVCVAVITAVVCDTIALWLQRYPIRLSDGGLVTALIVGLVLAADTPIAVVIATTAIAIASKHVLRIGRKPIFNPAAVGLLAAIVGFHASESWWGDLSAMPAWSAAIVLVVGYAIVQRVNKFPQFFSFFAVYLAFFAFEGAFHVALAADAFRNPIINSALFLACFMLTDPPTSPARYRHQIGFGAISAIVSGLIYLTFGGLSYLFIGLLSANLWKLWITRQKSVIG
ncbi:hypothetical protein Alches_27460 [Alicyclobacillus hesperidum subsp. aegles]|uniref:RnfABCDGE type electron transport complex subunit D n=1 Tax=Alicyclobacillus hesperidum TaxID=89784 RepID=UPI00222B0E22|nr:RnfABCDGE type electron transport complex subunit D [Alicyclobacillus hesperidum]GLG02705.1 hypothetical protein Alches_27460 [Alicyclobacillus hesperidum subsp. aegles]